VKRGEPEFEGGHGTNKPEWTPRCHRCLPPIRFACAASQLEDGAEPSATTSLYQQSLDAVRYQRSSGVAMPPGWRRKQLVVHLNSMGVWRDSVRSQSNEETDALSEKEASTLVTESWQVHEHLVRPRDNGRLMGALECLNRGRESSVP